MLAESKRLDEQIDSVKAQIKVLPEGDFFCARNENRYKWYYTNGKEQRYLPKSERPLAEALTLKKYLSLLLDDSIREKKAVDSYLKIHRSNKSEKLIAENPEYRQLLSSYFQPISQELADWSKASYDHNPYHPEHLIHKTGSGNLVRSKSEALIDMILHNNKIPFRYECALLLGNVTIYPDFTIRHPHTGKTYYWEHFGLMDDSVYAGNACSKIQLYTSFGILPGIHLITTYETKAAPLSIMTIEHLIQEFFL